MNVSGYIIFFVIFGLIQQFELKEGLQLEPKSIPCKTGHGQDGVCSERAYCNFGSTNVDSSLYAPRGFKKICSAGEVCCLLSNIIPQTTLPAHDNDNFNFDDDDD